MYSSFCCCAVPNQLVLCCCVLTVLQLSPGSKRILKEKQRMAQQVRSCSLDSAAAAASTALRHLHQQYHVTAHVHPNSLHYQPNSNSTATAAGGEEPGEEVTSAAAAAMGSPGGASTGSPASAGSAFLSRVKHQVKQQYSPGAANSPGAASSCNSGSPGSSSSFGYFGSASRGLRGSCGTDCSSSMGRSGSSATPAARGPDFTFKPAITRKAAAMKPRSVDDMSEGDRLRREAKLVSRTAAFCIAEAAP
jgi:hypothetical protein